MENKSILEKVYDGDKLSTRELKDLRYETANIVDIIEGKTYRYTKDKSIILKIKDKYFRLDYSEGLTEDQEDEFLVMPYEVKCVDKVIHVNEWVKAN